MLVSHPCIWVIHACIKCSSVIHPCILAAPACYSVGIPPYIRIIPPSVRLIHACIIVIDLHILISNPWILSAHACKLPIRTFMTTIHPCKLSKQHLFIHANHHPTLSHTRIILSYILVKWLLCSEKGLGRVDHVCLDRWIKFMED